MLESQTYSCSRLETSQTAHGTLSGVYEAVASLNGSGHTSDKMLFGLLLEQPTRSPVLQPYQYAARDIQQTFSSSHLELESVIHVYSSR